MTDSRFIYIITNDSTVFLFMAQDYSRDCYIAQGAQLSALWWPRGMGWGRWREAQEGRDISIHIVIHAVIEQKLTQHCKAITLQKKIKKINQLYLNNNLKVNRLCHLCVLVAQSCPTLCKAMDCSPPGSSVHGILQAGLLEWVTIPFSNSNKDTIILSV